jgi:hypothetical protein
LNDKPDLKPARLLPELRQRQDGSTAPNVGR